MKPIAVIMQYYDWSGGHVNSAVVRLGQKYPEKHATLRIRGKRYHVFDIKPKDKDGSPLPPRVQVMELTIQ
jgi:hypothetical protein